MNLIRIISHTFLLYSQWRWWRRDSRRKNGKRWKLERRILVDSCASLDTTELHVIIIFIFYQTFSLSQLRAVAVRELRRIYILSIWRLWNAFKSDTKNFLSFLSWWKSYSCEMMGISHTRKMCLLLVKKKKDTHSNWFISSLSSSSGEKGRKTSMPVDVKNPLRKTSSPVAVRESDTGWVAARF